VVDLRRGDLGGEALGLGADEERLVQLLPRDRAHAHAAVGLERDESERRESPQGLANGRPRDLEPLRQLLLAKDRPRLELAGDDRLLDHERDVVGLGGVEAHGRRSYAGSVRNSTNSGASATWAKISFASPPASMRPISSRTRASSKRSARCTQLQICEREISAVAASSIRLSIAAA